MPVDEGRQLRQCLTLALLLHLWLVLMFGNATGTARPGDGVWGRLNITLTGDRSEFGSASRGPQPELSEGPIGRARQQRFGGSVRPPEDVSVKAPRPTTPGAAHVGRWNAQRVEPTRPAQEAPQAAPEPPATAARMMAAPTAVARARPTPMAATQPAPAPLELAPLPSARVMVMEAAPALERSKPQAQAVTQTSGQTDGPRRLSKPPQLIAPLPPAVMPQFKPLPSPASLAAEPVVAPVLAAAPASAPVPAPEPAKLLAAPAELISRQAPSELTALPTAQPQAPLPPAQSFAPPAPAPSPAATSTPAPALAAPAIAAQQPGSTAPAPPSQAALQPAPAVIPSLLPVVPQPGAPDAGPRLGVDVATPASTPPDAPRLNLSLPRGGELSSRGSSGVLQMLPAPPEQKSKLSEELRKAAKEDCRKAYGEAGLLALAPLAVDAARTSKGCRW